jgi:hypothetical protein
VEIINQLMMILLISITELNFVDVHAFTFGVHVRFWEEGLGKMMKVVHWN